MITHSEKIFIVGAGHVGSHAAYSLVREGIAGEIVLYDIDTRKARAQAEDIADAGALLHSNTRISAAKNYAPARDANVLIIAAGPLPDISSGQNDRTQTLDQTLTVLDDILPKIATSGFSGILINVSNPADVITHYIQQELTWAPTKIFSTSTTLDSARLRRVLAQKLNIAPQSVSAVMLGEHGETQVPIWSLATIGGEPIFDYLKRNKDRFENIDLKKIETEATSTGWRILNGKGSTEFGIGTSVAEISRAIFRNEKRVFPVAVLLNGQYGQRDVFASVPAIISACGVEEILEIPLSINEREAFGISCEKNRSVFQNAISRSREQKQSPSFN